MLTPKQIEKAAEKIIPIWDDLKEWITLDIIDRITMRLGQGEDITFSSSEKHRISVFEELGGLITELQKRITATVNISEQQLKQVFFDYAETAARQDKEALNIIEEMPETSEKSTGDKLPSEQRNAAQSEPQAQTDVSNTMSERMRDIANDAYLRTNGELRNFTGTTADSVQTQFIEELDKAYLKVSSNTCSQWQAACEAIDNIIKYQGRVTYPSGHTDTIEVAVIRAIRTGIARMSAEITLQSAEENDMDYVVVSGHLGARVGDGGENPGNHAWWQSKVYKIEGSDKYPNLGETTGYPHDPHGLCGYNCRHSIALFDPDLMRNPFKQYDEEENKEYYENTQKQRKYEREIRKAKTEVNALARAIETATDPKLKDSLQTRLDEAKTRRDSLLSEYREFCNEHGFRVSYERMDVARSVNSNIDYMSNSFRPSYVDNKPIPLKIGNTTKSIEVKKVSNSKFTMVTDLDNTRRNKAVRLAEKNLTAIKDNLPKGFKLPQIAVVDFNKHSLNSTAIGGYDRNTGILYINSKYDTPEKILGFVNKTQGMFANNTQYAPILHELGHKYYYDSINKLAISKGIEYNKAKGIVDSKLSEFIRKSNVENNPLFIMKNLSGYAYKGYSDNLITEVIAESFSVMHQNEFAKSLIDTLNGAVL